jgi:hypothetical protein
MSKKKDDNTKPIDIRHAARNVPHLDFVLPGYLMRTTGVLVAPGGTGKSMFSLQLAFTVALGRDVFSMFDSDTQIRQGKVIIFNAEDEPEIIEMRINKMASKFSDADFDILDENVLIYPCVGRSFTIAQKGEYNSVGMSPVFAATIPFVKKQAPRLVIFDTMNRMAGGIDENDNGAMGQLMSIVERFNKATGTASLIIHHASKGAVLGGQGNLQQAGRGASVVTDNARFQINMSGMSKEEADKIGIGDLSRSSWVAIDYSKVNYGPPMERKWLMRQDGGWLSGDVHPEDITEALGLKPTQRHPKRGRRKATGDPY